MVVACERGARPGAFLAAPAGGGGAETCPFCEGQEGATPPEALALGPAAREPDSPGWRTRVVPNKYPAFSGELGRQEVVIHTPRHVGSLGELHHDEIAGIAEAWQARAAEARREGSGYVHAFVNQGRNAGASLFHSHSQLIWLREEPPVVSQEVPLGGPGCPLCRALQDELVDGRRVVLERGGLLLCCPYASRAPFELLVAPLACEPDAFSASGLSAALELAADGIRRLPSPDTPLNLWLHTAPFARSAGHWHIEIVPRLTAPAGLELGAGLYVNVLPPEDAAAAMRGRGWP